MSSNDFLDFQLPKYNRLNIEELTKIWSEIKEESVNEAQSVKPFNEKSKKTFIVQSIEEEEKSIFSERSVLGPSTINVDIATKIAQNERSILNKSNISTKTDLVSQNLSALEISKISSSKQFVQMSDKEILKRLESNKENDSQENLKLRVRINNLKENLEEQLSSRESPRKVTLDPKKNLKTKTNEIKKKIEELVNKKRNTSFVEPLEANGVSSKEDNLEDPECPMQDLKIIENDFGSCESKNFIQNSPTFFSPREFFSKPGVVCQSFADPFLARPKSFEEPGFNVKDSWQIIRESGAENLNQKNEQQNHSVSSRIEYIQEEAAMSLQESPKKRSTFLPAKSEEHPRNVSKLSELQKINVTTVNDVSLLSNRRKTFSEDISLGMPVSPLLQNFTKKGILSPKPQNKLMLEKIFNDIAQFQKGSSRKLSSEHIKNIVKLVVIIEKKISDQMKLIFLYYRGEGMDSPKSLFKSQSNAIFSDDGQTLDTQRENMRKMEEKLRRMEEILNAKKQSDRAQSDRHIIDRINSEYFSAGNGGNQMNYTDRPNRKNDQSNISITFENEPENNKKPSPIPLSGREGAIVPILGIVSKSPVVVSENNSHLLQNNELKYSSNLIEKGFSNNFEHNFYSNFMREAQVAQFGKTSEAEKQEYNMDLLERVFNISRREIRFVKKACFKKWYKKVSKQREMIIKGIRICESLVYMFKVYMKSHFFILKQNIKSKHFNNIKRASLLKMLLMNKIHCLDNYKRIYFTKFRALCSINDRDCSRVGTPMKVAGRASRTEVLKSAGLLAVNSFSNYSREIKKETLKRFYMNFIIKKTVNNSKKRKTTNAIKVLALRKSRDLRRLFLNKWKKATQTCLKLKKNEKGLKINAEPFLFSLKLEQILKSLSQKRLDVSFKYLQVNMFNYRNKEEGLKNLILKADFLIEKKKFEHYQCFFNILNQLNLLSKEQDDHLIKIAYLVQKMELRYAFGNLRRETEMVRITDTVNKYTYFCIRNALQSLTLIRCLRMKTAFESICKYSIGRKVKDQRAAIEERKEFDRRSRQTEQTLLKRDVINLATSSLEIKLRMMQFSNKNKLFQTLKNVANRQSSRANNITTTSERLETFLSWKFEKQAQGVYNILKAHRDKLILSNRLYQSYVIKVLAMKKLKFFFERRAICLREAFNRWNGKRFVIRKFMEKKKAKTLSILFNAFIRAGAPRNKEMLKDYILERFVIRFEKLLIRKALNAGFVRILGYKMKKLAVALHYYTPKSKKTKTGNKKGKGVNDEEVIKNIIVSPTNSSPKMISTLCKTPSNNNKSQFYINQSASLNHNLSTNLNNASLQSIGSTYMRKYF